MAEMKTDILRAIAHIEAHLTDDIRPEHVAQEAYLSLYHFQRVFGALSGVTLGEYIRLRRLTLAGEELSRGMEKVIDVAVKYGYESPDSFSRAFFRFHGLLPSAAREPGARLNAFLPMNESAFKKGGSRMEYKIVHKQAFTVVGVTRTFNTETSQKIPGFWEAYFAGGNKPVMGRFGVCIDSDGADFDYMIADLYEPWKEVPQGCDTHTFPAGTWAVFPCTLDMLQETNNRMWNEWLPAVKEYRLGGKYNLELYGPQDMNDVELWLPVEKV